MAASKFLLGSLLIGSILLSGCFLFAGDVVRSPSFSPQPGTYDVSTLTVSITSKTTDAQIFYTLDGSTPDDTSTLYTGTITLTQDTTLKARAYKESKASKVVTASYIVKGGIVANADVKRSFSANSVNSGDSVSVSLVVTVPLGATYYFVEETVPAGWAVTNNGGATLANGVLRWAVIQGAQDTTYRYSATAPSSGGIHTWDGQFQMENMQSPKKITGAGQVTVTPGTTASCTDGIQNQGETGVDCGGPCPACGGSNAKVERSFSASNVNSGQSMTVTLAVTVPAGATYYFIEETFPAGWAVTNNGGATLANGVLRWAEIQGAQSTTYTYTLTAPASGSYTWSGQYQMEGMSAANQITGSTQVTVGSAATCSDGIQNQGELGVDCGGPCPACTRTDKAVMRSFSASSTGANQDLTVTIDVTVASGETYFFIEEFVPSGWTITDTGGATQRNNELRWAEIQGAQSVAYVYTVNAPSSAGSHTWSGQYQIEGMSAASNIGGSTGMTVQ